MRPDFFDLHVLPVSIARGAHARADDDWSEDGDDEEEIDWAGTFWWSIGVVVAVYLIVGGSLVATATPWGADGGWRLPLFLQETPNYSSRVAAQIFPKDVSSADLALAGALLCVTAITLALSYALIARVLRAAGPASAFGRLVVTLNAHILAFAISVQILAAMGGGYVAAVGVLQWVGAATFMYAVVVARDLATELTTWKRLTDNHFSHVFDYAAAAAIAAYMSLMSGDVSSGIILGLAFVTVRTAALIFYDFVVQSALALLVSVSFVMDDVRSGSTRRRILPRARAVYRGLTRANVFRRSDELLHAALGAGGLTKLVQAATDGKGRRIAWPWVIFMAAPMLAFPPYVGALLWAAVLP